MQAPTVHINVDDKGTPRTINKRIKVHMIARKHIDGNLSVDEIAEHYGITLADIYSALAYYHDNQDYYELRAEKLKPLVENAKNYTAGLNTKIEARLAEKKSED